MGVAGQGQQQPSPANGSVRGRKSSHSEVGGDDPLEGVPHRHRTRDALREMNGYSVSKTVGSPPRQLSASTGNDDASSTYKSPSSIPHPTVKIRPEYGSVYRKDTTGEQRKQNVVCVVSVEVSSRRTVPNVDVDEEQWKLRINERGRGKQSSNVLDDDDLQDNTEESVSNRDSKQGEKEGAKTTYTEGQQRQSTSSDGEEGFSFSATPSANDAVVLDPFASVVEDIRRRIGDWKGHTVDRFGPLVLYDFLGVRQESIVREFYVYLFKEALLCVTEEKKKEKTLAKLMGTDDVLDNGNGSVAGSTSGRSNKPPLKLKGRIWLRHIRKCQDLDTDANGYCLSIKLDDESLDHFVLCFKEKGHREMWRERINDLLAQQSKSTRAKKTHNDLLGTPIDTLDEAKQHNLNRRYTAASTSVHSVQSGKSGSNNLLASPKSPLGYLTPPRQAASSQSDHGSKVQGMSIRGSPPPLSISAVPLHQQWSASGGLDPNASPPDLLPHTPIDLVIMVSIPSVASQPGVSTSSTLSSSASLKLRLVQSTLSFVISHLGANDRIALVAYNVGVDGIVRRTSLLNAARQQSREKLEQFVDSIGKPWEGQEPDPFQANVDRLGGSSDQTDTVTAVNVGFDIVLQRKSRNPVTAMLLINDTADAPRRGQMDLVLARAEAARVPVHCFGFGKSHDPSSLWLISNHTRGSYTFVKEWYQLRECVTGCIGSLMSVALTDVKLHISVPSDNHFKVRKVSGPTGAIVSSTGKDVDLELGELRFGDCKELFVELELDFNGLLKSMQQSTSDKRLTGNGLKKTLHDHYEKGSATDDFMQRLGLQGLNLSSAEQISLSQSYDQSSLESSNFIEEVAVLEVECGCKDPSTGSTTTRLPTPGVLTLEINANSPDPISNEAKGGSAGLATALADPVVTRRRLEILVSDMITRCLLLVSRRNHSQALTILQETRRIVDTVLQAIPVDQQQSKDTSFSSGNRVTSRSSQIKKQKELQHRKTALSLLAILEDLDVLVDGLESNQNISFERTERNFGAQQAMILRDQKAWTSRSDTEWQFHCNIDNAAPFAAQAAAHALIARNH